MELRSVFLNGQASRPYNTRT